LNILKTLNLIVIVLTYFSFVGCNSQSEKRCLELHTENALLKEQRDYWNSVSDSLVVLNDSLRQLFSNQKTSKKQVAIDSLGLSKLKFGPISEQIHFDPGNFSWLEWTADRRDFQYLTYGVHQVIKGGSTSIIMSLDDPGIFSGLLEANKGVLPVVLQKTGLWFTARFWAKRLLLYFDGGAPSVRIKKFDTFYHKYGHEEYGIPRDTPEWRKMQTSLGFSDRELNNEYWMYLFAKRRINEGGDELRKVWVEALTFLKNMEPVF